MSVSSNSTGSFGAETMKYCRRSISGTSSRARRFTIEASAVCEREVWALFGLYQEDSDNDDDEYDEYRYVCNYGPDQVVFLGMQRRQRAAERERKSVFAEQRKRRKAESRIRRSQEVRAFLEDLFHNLGMWTSDSTQKA